MTKETGATRVDTLVSATSTRSLTPSQIEDLRLAASKMDGVERRGFQAAMALKYCQGNARLAETVFGWGRQNIEVGLAEKRTGIICVGLQSALSGAKRWEEKQPVAALSLLQLAESHAQQDPTFKTSLAYTRLTAAGALSQLKEQGFSQDQLPSKSTMAQVLNRMGYRISKVVKAKPQKKLHKQTTEATGAGGEKNLIFLPLIPHALLWRTTRMKTLLFRSPHDARVWGKSENTP